MQEFEITAEPREDVGKGASRRLRRTGKLPGILYGTKKEVQNISLAQNELLLQLEKEAFYSHILTLKIGKKSEKVVLKDLQRHPVRPIILHVDFQRIDEKEKLTMRVPIHFINETSCVGVRTGGGEISHIMTEIEISCLPKDLPEFINVDMEEIELGDAIHLGDLVLPEGVEIYALLRGGDPARPVASVHIPRVEEEEEVEVVEGEEMLADVEDTEEPEAEQEEDSEES